MNCSTKSSKICLAVDIGASSGRHIIGRIRDHELLTEEVYRFPNQMTETDGSLCWDIDRLLCEVKKGIALAKEKYHDLFSISIDTWGVDYVLMNGDREILPCYAYRDLRTEAAIPLVHEAIPFQELYRRTGIQLQPFNTIYQLYADKTAGRLLEATDYLMMAEYLMYKLCGVKSHEYTAATTSGMISAKTGTFDPFITKTLGFPNALFHDLQQPGTVIGEYEGCKVVLCATHDTASAVEGIDMEVNAPYISSGTWSLLGLKTKEAITNEASRKWNWSNEGGIGYNRYQKNIMGLWIVNRLKEELCPCRTYDEIVSEATASRFDETVDANLPVFFSPKSMKEAMDTTLSKKPESTGDYFRCAYRSLANCYRDAIREMEDNVGTAFDRIYVVGGGAKNGFLNRLTEEASRKKVIALPIEATAIGNLKVQFRA